MIKIFTRKGLERLLNEERDKVRAKLSETAFIDDRFRWANERIDHVEKRVNKLYRKLFPESNDDRKVNAALTSSTKEDRYADED